ncbi:MAG TPA: tRNA guanosine(34) transglycosylase Tgt, partial [Nitrospiria bacterium]|nr:tRNA guanosine(34) transglycosylase Tgt [Nitrospiria bacterium]
MTFSIEKKDSETGARCGILKTAHGPVETPVFMPVGTAATVKTLSPRDLKEIGAQIILSNAYHLYLRPGHRLIREMGGLHRFMGWDGPILTDSGGFQLFSLAENTKVTEQSAIFRSHIDGRAFELSPERSIHIQEALGSDVAMVLDHVIALPATDADVRDACARTIRW